MIWYLLYPFRGTSRPPRLSVDHPVRRAFYRHGILTAQNWLAAMLVSCAIAAMLAYPTVLLSGNPTAGFTSKPHQIWAAARPVSDREGQNVDIEMRQLWVHGTYMKALQKDVLQQALAIQQKLVGDEDLATINASLNKAETSMPVQWGFHSPLMYWNNSAEVIEVDEDIVKTVNDQSTSSSSLDISLRPASVFAGKSFSKGKLVAADALVLTLMNRREDGLGLKWQQQMHTLGDSACLGCQLYPPHGQVSKSWLYDFTLTPVTFQENAALAFAYACMALYVLVSLRRLKAFHSRFGLVVTAITQMIMSILASFTICGLLKVNLVAVPQNAYPFILLVIGLENMFRLINAILAYPATMATDLRIANALGDVGPLSIATAAQNLLVLWLLSIVVSPVIVAFCAFAAIATLVDTFFLLTFFVAVLNVDIRRLELQDSISKSKEAAQRQKSPPPQRTWFDALLHGGLPLSTRMAGSVVTTTFILTLNYHFFERSDRRMAFGRLLGCSGAGDEVAIQFDAITSPPMNATLTPGEWVRMQDFDTAREVLRLVNNGAQSFVIRVFAPLVVVLSGADRTGVPDSVQSWKQDLSAITRHHLYPFAVAVVFIVTFVWVLMNFLLWNDAPEISEELPERIEDLITVNHIKMDHKLDIVKLAANKRGDLITAALDRTICISSIDPGTGSRVLETLPAEIVALISWPVRHMAIDTTGHWVALQHGHNDILICNRKESSVIALFAAPDDSPIILFQFASFIERDGDRGFFFMVTASGQATYQSLHDRRYATFSLCQQRLIAASISPATSSGHRLAIVSDIGGLLLFELRSDGSPPVSLVSPGRIVVDTKLDSAHIAWLATKDVCIVRTPGKLDLASEDRILCTRSAEGFGPVVIRNERECHACDRLALEGIGAVDMSGSPDTLGISSYGFQTTHDEPAMCLYQQSVHCAKLANAVISEHSVDNAGFALTLPTTCVVGLRRAPEKTASEPQLRRRREANRGATRDVPTEDVWEAYSLTLDGEVTTLPFSATETLSDTDTPDLYVTTAGPGVAIDEHSAAIAFGNVIKLVRVAKSKSSTSASNGVRRNESVTRKWASRKTL